MADRSPSDSLDNSEPGLLRPLWVAAGLRGFDLMALAVELFRRQLRLAHDEGLLPGLLRDLGLPDRPSSEQAHCCPAVIDGSELQDRSTPRPLLSRRHLPAACGLPKLSRWSRRFLWSRSWTASRLAITGRTDFRRSRTLPNKPLLPRLSSPCENTTVADYIFPARSRRMLRQ